MWQKLTNFMNDFEWIRVNNDRNGNPRYVLHFLNIASDYDTALKKAKKIGGRKYHNKQYGGGVVFQSYNIQDTENKIIEMLGNNA